MSIDLSPRQTFAVLMALALVVTILWELFWSLHRKARKATSEAEALRDAADTLAEKLQAMAKKRIQFAAELNDAKRSAATLIAAGWRMAVVDGIETWTQPEPNPAPGIEALNEAYAKACNALTDYRHKMGFEPGAIVRCQYRTDPEKFGTVAPYGERWGSVHHSCVPVNLTGGMRQPWEMSDLTLISPAPPEEDESTPEHSDLAKARRDV